MSTQSFRTFSKHEVDTLASAVLFPLQAAQNQRCSSNSTFLMSTIVFCFGTSVFFFIRDDFFEWDAIVLISINDLTIICLVINSFFPFTLIRGVQKTSEELQSKIEDALSHGPVIKSLQLWLS
jgi:ABC-type multidrug transport system fused ATPase/permease subunit